MKALHMSRFNFAISTQKTVSQRLGSTSSRIKRKAWIVTTRAITQIEAVPENNPSYLTLEDRLMYLPKDFSPKIEAIPICTCQPEGTDELYYLAWKRDTIHKSASIEEDYQKWILGLMEETWAEVEKVNPNLKRTISILVLEHARASSNPTEELAHNEKFLFGVLLPYLHDEQNRLSSIMYKVVARREVKRGVWEYTPREEA